MIFRSPNLRSRLALLSLGLLLLCGACSRDTSIAPGSSTSFPPEILERAERLGFTPEAVAEARSLSPDALRDLVGKYLRETHQSESYWRLLPAVDLATPHLIAAFELPDAFRPNNPADMMVETPASRALSLLKPGAHPELKPHLLRALASADRRGLADIAHHLAAFGDDELLPKVRPLFEHADDFITVMARMGAQEAVKAGRAGPAFRAYLAEHLRARISGAPDSDVETDLKLLVALDREGAKTFLSDPALHRVDHPAVAGIISTLTTLGAPPPAERLHALYQSASGLRDYLRDNLRSRALLALASLKDPALPALVDSVLAPGTTHSHDLQLAAWEARFRFHGLVPLYDSAAQAYEKADYRLAALSANEADFMRMHYLDAEVRNGGFSQWYFNGADGDARAAVRALEKIGATKHAALVARANRLFGLFGPPRDEEALRVAVEKLSEAKSEKMSALDEAWYALPPWSLHAFEWDWENKTR